MSSSCSLPKAHRTLHPILDHRLALARRPEPDHRGHPRGAAAGLKIAATAIVAGGPALGACALAPCGKLLRRAVAVVRGTLRQQLARHLSVSLLPLRLEHRRLVAAQPSQLRPSKIAWIAAAVERARSVSSMRSRYLPPWCRA